MAENELDISKELISGKKSPGAIFSELESLVDAQMMATDEFAKDVINHIGLKDGDKIIKNVVGSLRDPVAARISVLDMKTSSYIITSTKFILTSINIANSEKVQATHSLDEEWLLSVFGKEIPVYTIGGVLMNYDGEGNWIRYFKDLYENYLRAYILAKNKWMAVLHYSNRWIRGYFTNYTIDDRSEYGTYVPFTMMMIVRKDKAF
ncbi:MAG: hypothetical protein WCY30_00535 [Candidatus Neomarinimicrobiota bacterium]|jgi:hypothetical protein